MVTPKCIIMIGLPGSGKSTIADAYARIHNAEIFSTDRYIENLAKVNLSTYNAVFSNAIKIAEEDFKASMSLSINLRKSVIIDRTNLRSKKRMEFVKRFKEAGYRVVYVVVKRKKEELDRVNDERKSFGRDIDDHIRASMASSFEEPSYDEGVDDIVYYGEGDE